MSGDSKNKISKLKTIRAGLAIYQTGRSTYWYVRLWDPVTKKYLRRSSKETSRIEASEVAVEFADSYRKKIDPSLAAVKDRSFETYARKLDAFNKASGGNAQSYSDGHKILFREGDGLISYFGKYDVGKITSGEMRDYLDPNRCYRAVLGTHLSLWFSPLERLRQPQTQQAEARGDTCSRFLARLDFSSLYKLGLGL